MPHLSVEEIICKVCVHYSRVDSDCRHPRVLVSISIIIQAVCSESLSEPQNIICIVRVLAPFLSEHSQIKAPLKLLGSDECAQLGEGVREEWGVVASALREGNGARKRAEGQMGQLCRLSLNKSDAPANPLSSPISIGCTHLLVLPLQYTRVMGAGGQHDDPRCVLT